MRNLIRERNKNVIYNILLVLDKEASRKEILQYLAKITEEQNKERMMKKHEQYEHGDFTNIIRDNEIKKEIIKQLLKS